MTEIDTQMTKNDGQMAENPTQLTEKWTQLTVENRLKVFKSKKEHSPSFSMF